MSMFENFPYTNLHNLNLDWIINTLTELEANQVLSVNGQTGNVVLYQDNYIQFPAVSNSDWSMIRMADGTTRGILFGDNDSAYIVHGNLMSKIYAANNPPPYPVTSVNGQTGAITLYTEQNIQLPGLTDEQLHDWNVFRNLNGVARGIRFDEDGSAYIISGIQRYKLYSTKDIPPYPVTSVNGQTGAIVLFTDGGGEVEFPAITDQSIDTFILERVINGRNVGISIHDNGGLELLIGNEAYTIYTENDPPADWVDDPTDDIIQISDDAVNTTWGLIRDTPNGSIGILFNNSASLTNPQAELRYVDSNHLTHTVKLLTPADIPSSSGVVSINGLAGVVTLDGSNLTVSDTDSRTIANTIAVLENETNTFIEGLVFEELTNTATHNINAGYYVYWNNGIYKATANISINDPLTSSNLDPVFTAGAINELHDQIAAIGTVLRGEDAASLVVGTGSWTNISSLYLEPGTYVINGGCSYSTSFTQAAEIRLVSGTSTALVGTLVAGTGANGGAMTTTTIREQSTAGYVRLSVYQSSGSNKTASNVMFRAIKIG